MALCTSDLQCANGEVCTELTCVPGARQIPTINAVDGDHPTLVCPDGEGTYCVQAGIVVRGANLVGAQFTLSTQGGGQPRPLVLRGNATDTVVELDMPSDVGAGGYVLTAANQSGSADQAVTLLQGPPGPDMTPEAMVSHINTATNVLDLALLPVGTDSGSVASGEHEHSGSDLTSGTVGFARLPVGDTDSTVAVGNHGHDGTAITSGTVGFARLPVGDTDSTVAVGNHGHDGAAITSGIVGFAYLPVGATSSTIAAGNHTHAEYLPFTGGDLTGSLGVGGDLDVTGNVLVTGNVGIGVASPTRPLEVAGQVIADNLWVRLAQVVATDEDDFSIPNLDGQLYRRFRIEVEGRVMVNGGDATISLRPNGLDSAAANYGPQVMNWLGHVPGSSYQNAVGTLGGGDSTLPLCTTHQSADGYVMCTALLNTRTGNRRIIDATSAFATLEGVTCGNAGNGCVFSTRHLSFWRDNVTEIDFLDVVFTGSIEDFDGTITVFGLK